MSAVVGAAKGKGIARAIVEAARAGATFAEIAAALGEGSDAETITPLAAMRDASAFEALRARAASAPSVALIAIGDARALRPRVDFARELLALAGIGVTAIGPHADASSIDTPAEETIVLCAADDAYADVLSALSEKLAGRRVFLARKPDAALRADGFLHRDADRIEVLTAILDGADRDAEKRADA